MVTLAFFVPAGGVFAETSSGTVVVAKTAPDALFMWDASPVVADLVIAQKAPDAGMRDLEIAAIKILAARAPNMRANQLEIRAGYAATGVVGAAYQAATFANASPLFTIRAKRTDVLAHAKQWESDLAAGRAPKAASIVETGKFPHAQ